MFSPTSESFAGRVLPCSDIRALPQFSNARLMLLPVTSSVWCRKPAASAAISGAIDRPDWFPQGPELDEWAKLVAHPRENSEKLKELGFDMESLAVLRAAGGGPQQEAHY